MTRGIKNLIASLIDIPSTDPDDARRRKVTNTLVLIIAAVATLQIATVSVMSLLGLPLPAPLSDPVFLRQGYINTAAVLGLCVLIYVVNRFWSGLVAGSLFTILAGAAIFLNIPDHTLIANLTFALSIGVVLATLFVQSYAGFAAAGLSTVVVAVVGNRVGAGFYIASAGNFFGVALLSWFAARSLENALRDLRVLNLELDQRVQDRTRDLAESLARIQAILDSSADGVIFFDKHGKVIVANPAVVELIDIPSAEIVGQDIRRLVEYQEETEDDRRRVVELVSTGGASDTALKFQWGARTLSATVAPVRGETLQESIGTVAVFRDFTREAEIDRMKSTFVSIASHELRTPLNAIMGYAELLHEQVYGPLTDRQHDATNRILANTNHMLSLANNLLDRAQIEAGTLELNIADFSPSDVVSEAVNAMEILARSKGLELTSQAADDLPETVTGDWQRVNQVVVNLIGNAVKFTGEGGVHVRVYSPDEDHWAVDVSDTGIGIPAEAQEYIFEPFRQADESPTREYGGAGLGLSIIKQLVTMMGGKVDLKSEIGKGSTFTVTLPVELHQDT
jgi:PAS domain S-box-containing protein